MNDGDRQAADERAVALADFGDFGSAWLLASCLADREIASWCWPRDPVAAALRAGRVVVSVRVDAARARWLLAAAEATDAEVWFLATGELDPEAAKEASAWPRGRRGWAAAVAHGLGAAALGVLALVSVLAAVSMLRG